MEFNPKRPLKDMILNLIAEQNLELMEEVQDIKNCLKGAIERLSVDMTNNVEAATMPAFQNINEKISKLERLCVNNQNISQPPVPPAPRPAAPGPAAAKPPPPQTSQASSEPSSTPARPKRRRTRFQQKPKVLYIGDSVACNADTAYLEKETNCRIRTRKAYSSIDDSRARWPKRNFTDIVPQALYETQHEDKFSHLVLAAPTVDISNMNTANLTVNDNIEVYKQKVLISCENMFTVANNALKEHKNIEKVILMEHAPRLDLGSNDPTRLKSKLAKFANSSLQQLLNDSTMKERIMIGRHWTLECSENMIDAMYMDNRSGK